MLYNFPLQPGKEISDRFLQKGVNDFQSALVYVQDLPYKRNSHKNYAWVVLEEEYGTCSTKHALLKLLADENDHHQIKLMMGIYRMNGVNTPPVKSILEKYKLEYMPEAHNYLRTGAKVIDITKRGFANTLFVHDLLEEEEITPDQINAYKVSRHKAFLAQWLEANKQVSYHLEELWQIREACIEALAGQ